MPVLLPSETGKQLQVAISGNKICSLVNPDPILEVLRYVMVLVGVRAANLPNAVEKDVLVTYICRHYGGHTPEEIKLAFEMAINGQLELKSEDVTSYENFSVLYVARIMNAYQKWASQEFRQSIKEDPPEQVIYTDQQLDDLHRGDVENFYQMIKDGKMTCHLPDYFKDILVKDGLMKADDSLADFFVTRLGKGFANIYVKEKYGV